MHIARSRDDLSLVAIPSTAARSRSGLLRTTALQSLVVLAFVTPALIHPASAQPAPSARPAGGVVVGGAASIGQTATTTTVAQSTQRAAIDWRSFDIGAAHTVQFQQPNASAVVLNRVTGPDPSHIAGAIRANGQVVITNQSGVVFHQGAQVDAAGLVVSAAGISTPNFMAGRMVFDQAPKPDAVVSNAGTITIKQAGLAALVAPRVANTGVINAQMGRVVLAGAETHTIDLYGDGLLSIDVTKQVRQAPRGADGKPVTALVTNTGTIVADGGSVQLTAAAADGIVQTLVQAGGRIQANAAGGRSGTVLLAGVGGAVRLEGTIVANGGGTVMAGATGPVTVAAAARIRVNGTPQSPGGGNIQIGTRTGRATTIEAGATLSASGRGTGNGGRVAILSGGTTKFDGAIKARGGAQGGDGGGVEVSGQVVGMTGTVDAGAPHGKNGAFLIDPTDVTISDHGGNGTVVTPASLEATTGNVTVQATNSLVASSSVALTGSNQSLNLTAGTLVQVDPGVALSAATGSVNLTATAGVINVLGDLSAGSGINLNATGSITQGANSTITATRFSSTNLTTQAAATLLGTITTNALTFAVGGAVSQGAGGTITANDLNGSVDSLSLTSRNNQISGVGTSFQGPLTAVTGDIAIVTSGALRSGYFSGYNSNGIVVPNGHAISLTADTLNLVTSTGVISAPNGLVTLQPYTAGRALQLVANTSEQDPATLSLTQANVNAIATGTLQLGTPTGGAISLGNAGDAISLTGNATRLDVQSGSAVSQDPTATLTVSALSGTADSVTLAGANSIGQIGALTVAGALTVNNVATLTVNGPVSVGGAATISTIRAAGITLAGDLSANSLALTTGTGGITQTAGTVTVAGTASFISGAGITQSGGTIVSPLLTGRATGRANFASTSNQVTGLGDFTSANGFALSNAAGLTVSGTVRDPNSVTLTTVGSANLTGTISTGTLTFGGAGTVSEGSAGTVIARDINGTVAALSLTSRNNQIAGLGTSIQQPLTATTGDIAVVTSSNLQVGYFTGGVFAPNGRAISLTTDALTVRDVLSATRTEISAPNGLVALQPFTAGRQTQLVATPAEQDPATLSLTQSNLNVIATGTLQLGTTTAGAVSLGNAGDAIDLTGHATTLNVLSAGAVTQDPTATLTVSTLSGNAGSVTLTGANHIDQLGALTTAGALTVDDAGTLTVTGPVSAGAAASLSTTGAAGLTLAGDLAASSLRLAAGTGGITQTAGTVSVPGAASFTSGGDITQSGGTMLLGSLGGSSAGTATLTATTNVIPVLSGFTAGTTLDLATASGLAVNGPVTAGASIRLGATGTMSLANTVSAPTVSLDALSIVQPSGVVTAGTLNVTANDAALAGTVGTLGTVQVPGTFTLTDNAATLDTSGTVTIGTLNLTAGSVTFGPATIGTLRLASGNVQQSGGLLQVGTLTGSSSGGIALGTGSGTATIGVVFDVSAARSIGLTDSAGLIVAGTIRTPQLTLGVAGSLTLQGGTIIADGVAVGVTGPGPVTLASAGAQQAGAAIAPQVLAQTGTTTFAPLTTAGQIALTVSGGVITLSNLNGPGIALTLAMGGGRATGAINVGSLFVNDQGGSATLTGTVAGQTGAAAATVSTITRFDTAYTLNGCAIASISCGSITLGPPGSPTPLPPQLPTPTPTPTSTPAPAPAPAPAPTSITVGPPSIIRPDIVLVEGLLRPYIIISDLITLDVTRSASDPDFVLPNISDRDY